MSSNIPTRRTTRVTRTATAKDTENANARPSRSKSRAKPPSSGGTKLSANDAPARVTATTAASRAKANGDAKVDSSMGKRKRAALGEVTRLVTNSRTKPAKGLKKDKDLAKEKFDGVILKDQPASVGAKKRVNGGTATRRTTRRTAADPPPLPDLEEVQEEPEIVEVAAEDVMVVDHPVIDLHVVDEPVIDPPVADLVIISPAAPEPVLKPAPTLVPELSRRKSGPLTDKIPTPVFSRPPESRQVFVRAYEPVDDEESKRAHKKRRTSSDPPPEASTGRRSQGERDLLRPDLYIDLEPEADPKGDQWEDLDAEDGDDPLMASEYVVEIFEYLRQTELTTLPNPNYMESQHDLAWKMRGILIDWLIQVHARFHLLPETLFLSVNLVDRFLSLRVVSLAKLQLVGITCMLIASKFEEIVSPSVSHLLYCSDASYTEPEILQAERYVLKTLNWNMSYPNPVHYLRRVSKADDYDLRVRTVAKYLLEIGCLEWRLLAAPPSLLAAAAIWFARLVLGQETWTPNLAHYSQYAESSLVPTANLMLNYILKPIRHVAFFKKFAGKRYLKASVHLRDWALDRWPEDTQVSLAKELPRLKAEVRLMREREEAAAVAELENYQEHS